MGRSGLVAASTCTFTALLLTVGADGTAGDAMGPACSDFAGGASLTYSAVETPGEAVAAISFDLAAASCADWIYTLYVLDATGQRELVRSGVSGNGQQRLTITTSVPGDPVLPPSSVCLFTSTRRGDRVADVAPDAGCAPAQLLSSGHGDHAWH